MKEKIVFRNEVILLFVGYSGGIVNCVTDYGVFQTQRQSCSTSILKYKCDISLVGVSYDARN